MKPNSLTPHPMAMREKSKGVKTPPPPLKTHTPHDQGVQNETQLFDPPPMCMREKNQGSKTHPFKTLDDQGVKMRLKPLTPPSHGMREKNQRIKTHPLQNTPHDHQRIKGATQEVLSPSKMASWVTPPPPTQPMRPKP
jgi:hypothetical protein